MADDKRNGRQDNPLLKTIDSNIIDIERGTLRAAAISFQISNIASLEVEEGNKSVGIYDPIDAIQNSFAISLPLALISGCVGGQSKSTYGDFFNGFLSGFFLVGVIAFIGCLIYFMSRTRPDEPHQLKLLTNAASSFRILDKDKSFLLRLKAAIEDAMHMKDNSVSYHIEKVEQKIDRVVTASGPGSIATGGDIRDSKISINATVQGLQDVTELMGLVEKTAGANAAVLKAHLEVVQSHLAGGARTKMEAKAA